jgi:hypothetical protein
MSLGISRHHTPKTTWRYPRGHFITIVSLLAQFRWNRGAVSQKLTVAPFRTRRGSCYSCTGLESQARPSTVNISRETGTASKDKTIVFRGQGSRRGAGPGLLPRVSPHRIFLLSPANAMGDRAQMLLRPEAKSDLAQRLRGTGVSLGELFTFMSSLYFRGKLTYSQAFANPPVNCPGTLIITPSRGLLPPETTVTLRQMQEISLARVDHTDDTYRQLLERDTRLLMAAIGRDVQIVLLGSIATPKYVEPLVELLGEQLLFPSAFVGRGDMSRGGLLLRCSRERTQLDYAPVSTTIRKGRRPAKLAPNRRAKRKRTQTPND